MSSPLIIPALFLSGFACAAFCAEKATPPAGDALRALNKGYNRIASRVLVRRVVAPTRANLDLAAYDANVMLYDSAAFETTPPKAGPKLSGLHFENALVASTIKDRTEKVFAGKKAPPVTLHWGGLREYLIKWDFEKSRKLIEAMDRVKEEKWGNDDAGLPLQEVTRLYLSDIGEGKTALWARVEFRPWARFFAFVDDEDRDGFPEILGRVSPELATGEILDRIKNHYAADTLSRDGVVSWANELAAFWYPTYNTDIYKTTGAAWPDAETEPEVKKEMGGLSLERPIVVIRGKPFGFPVYNVFTVDGMLSDAAAGKAGGASVSGAGKTDPSVPAHIKGLLEGFRADLAKYGKGSYQDWAGSLQGYQDAVRAVLKSEPDNIKGFPGRDGFLFFRNTLNYLCGGELTLQAPGKNPFPAVVELKKQLERAGVDFLFVPVPVKPEVYPDRLAAFDSKKQGPFVFPYGRKFIHDLVEAGVDVVNLLPLFLAERDRPCRDCELLYQKQDTHWTTRGLELAARAVAERIRQYAWYASLPRQTYTVRDSVFQNQGDIVSRLKPSLQPGYRPVDLVGRQVVLPDNSLYKDVSESPIVILGDSFTGVYERTGCRSAGVSAHIAREIGHPVELTVGYGGGPSMIKQVKKMGRSGLAGKKLVVWIMAARDFYDYFDEWEVLTDLQ